MSYAVVMEDANGVQGFSDGMTEAQASAMIELYQSKGFNLVEKFCY